MIDDFPPTAPMRPIWLVTLADLALLLLGFLVLVQATERADRKALVAGLRDRFGATGAAPLPAPAAPMPVAAFATTDFAIGSAALPGDTAALVAWARQALADPRVALNVAGTSDGTAADVDPVTRSGAVLAADRARAVVALLAAAHVTTGRLALATTPRPGMRRVIVTLAFAGEPARSLP